MSLADDRDRGQVGVEPAVDDHRHGLPAQRGAVAAQVLRNDALDGDRVEDALEDGALPGPHDHAVVEVPGRVVALAHVEVGEHAEIHVVQDLVAVVGDLVLDAGDALVSRQRRVVVLLVHLQAERAVCLPVRVAVVHRLGLIVAIVRGRHLVARKRQVLVHLPVAVVVLAVEDLLVHLAVAVVVHPASAPGAPAPADAHLVVGVEGRAPLGQRAARDAALAVLLQRPDPEVAVLQQLDAAAARVLERGIEGAADVVEGVAEHADVGRAEGVAPGVEQRPAVLDVHHRAGRGRADREREQCDQDGATQGRGPAARSDHGRGARRTRAAAAVAGSRGRSARGMPQNVFSTQSPTAIAWARLKYHSGKPEKTNGGLSWPR